MEYSSSEVRRRDHEIGRSQSVSEGEGPRLWLQAAAKAEDSKPTDKEPEPRKPDGGPDAAGTDSDPNAAIKKERAKEREGERPPEPKGGDPGHAAE